MPKSLVFTTKLTRRRVRAGVCRVKATYNTAGFANASKGYLSEIADTTDNTKYLRDGFGRVVKKTQQLAPFAAGTAKSISYSYASGPTGTGNGQLNSITYPNGTKVSYVFSPAGQISQVNWGNNPLVANIQYTPLGQPASWEWQFADTSATTVLPATRSYDTAGRVVATELGTYTYDAAGRITSLTQQLAKPANTTVGNNATTTTLATFTIGYDSLGRITSLARAAGTGAANTAPLPAQLATFTYDANGNRLTSSQSTGTGTARLTANRSYSVTPASNQIQSFSQTLLSGTATSGVNSSVNYQTDLNGAMLSDGLRRYEYDAANRLANITTGVGIDAPTTRYVHNALGQRLYKTEPQFAPVASDSNPTDPGVMQTLLNFFGNLWGGSTTPLAPSVSDKLGFQYYYDEDGSLLYEQGSGGASSTGSTHYVYLPTPAGPMPIATYTGARHYAVHTDHLNTPRRLTQSNKTIAWQWAFSAFGDELPTTAKNRFVDTTNNPSLGTTTIADVTFNLRYPGQYADKESGLYYNARRSYAPNTGRYTQPDPISLAGGWNKFAYVDSNPLMYSDPLGLAKKLDPNSQECRDHRRKINNYKTDINKRIREILANSQGLPYYPPYPNAPARASVQGHEDLIQELRDNLRDREKTYDDKCGDDDPPTPPTAPAPVCDGNCKNILVPAVGFLGTVYMVWRMVCGGPY